MFENNKKNFVNKNSMKIAINLFSKIGVEEDLVFLCLGSQGVVFDKLAVVVADLLKYKYNISNYVYGGTNVNITRSNLKAYLDMIERCHAGSKVVVIDCALSNYENVGQIKVYGCGTVAGAAFHDDGIFVGDYSIIGVIGEKSSLLTTLLLTERKLVNEMASQIASGINEFLKLRKYFNLLKE